MHGDLWFYGDMGVMISDAYDLSAALEWLWNQAEQPQEEPPLIIAGPTDPRM